MGKNGLGVAVAICVTACIIVFSTFSSVSVDSSDIITAYNDNTSNITSVSSTFIGDTGNASTASSGSAGGVSSGMSVHGNTPEIQRYLEIARQVHVGWYNAGLDYHFGVKTMYNGDEVRQDCSGYVSYVLYKAGILNSTTGFSSDGDLSSFGFVKYYPKDDNDVEDGDIVAWAGSHTQILVSASTLQSYNWGDPGQLARLYNGHMGDLDYDPLSGTGTLWKSHARVDLTKKWKYAYVWRYVGKGN